MKQIGTILLCITLLAGCRKDMIVPVDVSDSQAMLVMNGYVAHVRGGNDTMTEIQVSRSAGVSQSANPFMIQDAYVRLAYDGFDEQLFFKPSVGSYVFNHSIATPQHINYTSSVKLDNGERIEASDAMPGEVPFTELVFTGVYKEFQYNFQQTSGGITTIGCAEVKAVFNDPASEHNYYHLYFATSVGAVKSAFKYGPYGDGDPYSWAFSIPFFTFDPAVLKEQPSGYDILGSENSGNNISPRHVMLTDESFNGQQKELLLYVPVYLLTQEDSSGGITPLTLYASLHNISKGSYDYFKTYQIYRHNRENPFAEPTIVYSNVKGGLGFVGCRSIAIDSVKH
jgi:hypothetical protein